MYVAFGSPSLAVRMYFPSGEKVIISGSAPTVITLISLLSLVLKTATLPLSVLLTDSMAAANFPSCTLKLFTRPP
ncbi:hypothetical protein D3C71_1778990 [compost metagenome]